MPSPACAPAAVNAATSFGEVDEDLVARGLAVQCDRTHGSHCGRLTLRMNTQPNVFTPAKLGPVTLRNRIIKAATFEASTPNALVTDDLIDLPPAARRGRRRA